MYLRLKKVFTLTIIIALIWGGEVKSSPHEVVVAQDGSGNFTTIAKAVAAAPNNSDVSYYIHIKAGIYAEHIIIDKWKTNLVLIGEGMDRTVITGMDRTVITGNRSVKGGLRTYETATVGMSGKNFVAEGITFQNVAGPEMDQAVALMSEADNAVFLKCRFLGYQDTLYTRRGYQFFRDCEIAGTVDFIFGDATVVFQNCLIIARTPLPGQSNVITAQGRQKNETTTGTVLHNCTIVGETDLTQQKTKIKTYLGRPWKIFSRTVIMQSSIGALVDPQGWLEWNETSPTDNVYYAEYQNTGRGNSTSHRVEWARVLNDPHDAEKFTVRNFLQGDNWIPSRIPYSLDLL